MEFDRMGPQTTLRIRANRSAELLQRRNHTLQHQRSLSQSPPLACAWTSDVNMSAPLNGITMSSLFLLQHYQTADIEYADRDSVMVKLTFDELMLKRNNHTVRYLYRPYRIATGSSSGWRTTIIVDESRLSLVS